MIMSISCAGGKHLALPRPVRNQGFEFGRCGRCGHDLVRSRRAWRAVPEGFRVVWRREPPGAAETSTAQLDLNLAAESVSAPPIAHPRSRAAVGAELLLLGLRGLASVTAERVRVWFGTRAEPRVSITGALSPPLA